MREVRKKVENSNGAKALNTLNKISTAMKEVSFHAEDPVLTDVFEEDVLLYLKREIYDIRVGIDVQINEIMHRSVSSISQETVLGSEDS